MPLPKPLINIRRETLVEKKTFKDAFQKRRCLIPANGFYEWKKEGRHKIPVYISLPEEDVFAMAGIYEDWVSPDGEVVRTCAIITVPANEILLPIHERMPAIVAKALETLWLNPHVTDREKLASALMTYPSGPHESL